MKAKTFVSLGSQNKQEKKEKPCILITAKIISGPKLWTNGLHQNCLFLYKLFENAGFTSFFLCGETPSKEDTNDFKTIGIDEYDKNPFHVYAFIEMGWNCSEQRRKLLQKNGTKNFKLILGNNLNIDIEIPIMLASAYKEAVAHVPGSCGIMLNSPHHYFTKEYTQAIYNVETKSQFAPYVWEPTFIQDLKDTYKWTDSAKYSFTIMEPNISFLKCSIIPIMICESYYRSNPDKMDGVVVINGVKLNETDYFSNNVASNLELHRNKRLFLIKRLTIIEAATTFKQNIVICHAVNNDYNYLFLEYLFMGFPVIHNYAMLKEYGYYYESNDIEAGKQMIEYVIANHCSRLEAYKASCHQLFWKFSIYNPVNINGWKDILLGV